MESSRSHTPFPTPDVGRSPTGRVAAESRTPLPPRRFARLLSAPVAGPLITGVAVLGIKALPITPGLELAFAPILFLLVALAAFEGGLPSGLGAAAVLVGYEFLALVGMTGPYPVENVVQFAGIAAGAPALAIMVGLLRRRASLFLAERTARAEAEAALARRQVDESYRRLVEYSPEGVAVHDGERFLFMNPAGRRVLGLSAGDEIVGRRLRSHVVELGAEAAAGTPRDVRLRSRTGRIIEAEFLEMPVQFSGRDATQVIVRDVTERRAVERRLAAEHAVSRVLADARDLVSAAPAILDALARAFPWRAAVLWTRDPDGETLTPSATWPAGDGVAGRFLEATRALRPRLGYGLAGQVWARRAPIWVGRVADDVTFTRARAAAQDGLHAAYAFPVFAGDELVAAFEFFGDRTAEPTAPLVGMLGAVAADIGMFIRKTEVEAELRRSTERLHAVLRHAAEAITAEAPDGRIILANDAAARMFGFDDIDELTAAAPDRRLARVQLLSDDGSPLSPESLPGQMALLGAGSPRRTVGIRVRGSTDVRWLLVRSSPVRAADGQVQFAISLFSDVTELMRYQEALESANERHEAITDELGATVRELRLRTAESEAARAELRDRAAQLRLLVEASRVLASSLEYEQTLERVARLVAEHLADACVIFVTDPDQGCRDVAGAHADGEREPLLTELRAALRRGLRPAAEGRSAGSLEEMLARGEPVLVSDLTGDVVQAELGDTAAARLVALLGFGSAMVVPLRVRDVTLGVIGFARERGRGLPYDESALRLAEELAGRIAMALDNALLFRTAMEQGRRAEQAASQIARLQQVTAELSRAITPGEVARVILQQGLEALGCVAGAVALVRSDAREREVEVVRAVGYPASLLRPLRRFPLSAELPLADACRTGMPIYLSSFDELRRSYPALANAEGANPGRSWAVLPLVANRTTIGAIGMSFGSSHEVDEAERAFMGALARQCAQALDRARLFEAERGARKVAEAAEHRLAFVSEASGALAVSLDTSGIVAQLTRMTVASMADVCCLHLLSDDGRIAETAVACARTDDEDVVRRELALSADTLDPDTPIVRVLRTGQPLVLETIDPAQPVLAEAGPDQVRALQRLGVESMLLVPLLARGRRLGAMLLLSRTPRRRYGVDDLALALEVGRRAALAIDNARLFANAQEANRAKADFLAVMSHELRTPLNAVIGYTDLLQTGVSGGLTEQQDRQLARIKASALHLLGLIEEVLTFARTEAGKEEIRLGDVDLRGVARDALALVEPQAHEKGLRIDAHLPPGPVIAVTDSGKLRQILVNLLSNAVKFTPAGHVALTLHPVADGRVQIDVQDTGPGIDPEHQVRVFEPFWQAEQGTTRHVGGAGLGLAVVHRLARLLAGDVALISAAGAGSTFTVEIPVRYPQPGPPFAGELSETSPSP
jgi:PAS domain S-box-containing protein